MKMIDMHCDTISALYFAADKENLKNNHLCVDLNGLKKAEVAVQFFACYVNAADYLTWDEAYQVAIAMSARIKAEQDESMRIVRHDNEIAVNIEENRISAVITIEEGGILNKKAERLNSLYEAGVRLITLTWNYENCLGYPNSSDTRMMTKGLKPFGIEVVQEMNRRGIMIDVSHLSDGGFWDCIQYSKRPVCATHSNARSLCSHPRNLSDEMLRALAQKGGVAGLNFYPRFLNHSQPATCEDIVRHARHMIQVAGEDVVAIGTDFDGFPNEKRDGWISHVSEIEQLWPYFKASGLTERQIEKICFQNARRFISETIK